jgi:hypothetical protein
MEVDRQELINSQTKRALELGQLKDSATDKITGESGFSNEAAAMVIEENIPVEKIELEHVNDCKKRSKKDGADSTSLGSAGSLVGSVRSQ